MFGLVPVKQKMELLVKAVENKTMLTSQTKNGITGYNLYLSIKDKPMKNVTGGSYWSETKGYHWITSWGLNRPLELWLQICYMLGLEFKDLKQNMIRQL